MDDRPVLHPSPSPASALVDVEIAEGVEVVRLAFVSSVCASITSVDVPTCSRYLSVLIRKFSSCRSIGSFRDLDLLFRLMEEKESIYNLQGNLDPDIRQDVCRPVFTADACIHTVLRFPPLPEIPVGNRQDVPVFLILVGPPRDARRVSVLA